MSTEVQVGDRADESAALTHKQILAILAGLMMAMFLAALDQTIVATAMRTIADDLSGFSLQAWQSAKVSDQHLLDTVAAMTLNGLAFYGIAVILRLRGTDLMAGAAGLLFAVSPFAVLQPLADLVRTNEYSLRYDWIYLATALTVTVLSEHRQRKSFYYAGLLNTGAALYLIVEHRHWFDRPSWGITLILVGLVALVAGFVLDRQSRTRRSG